MKKLRRLLMVLAAPSAAILGLTQLGGTPLYKGYNTGLTIVTADSLKSKLEISTDAGDLTCWVKLQLPGHPQSLSANLSTGTALLVYQESVQETEQWIAIVAEGQKPQEKFNWPSGAILSITSTNGESITPSDWQVYLSDQAFDSKGRATWRTITFGFSVVFFFLFLTGITLEALAKWKDESTIAFTHERCLNELIMSTEGASPRETEWMQSILRKVLLGNLTVADAIAPIPLHKLGKKALWFKTRDQFRLRLERLIKDLNIDVRYLRQ